MDPVEEFLSPEFLLTNRLRISSNDQRKPPPWSFAIEPSADIVCNDVRVVSTTKAMTRAFEASFSENGRRKKGIASDANIQIQNALLRYTIREDSSHHETKKAVYLACFLKGCYEFDVAN